MKNTSVNAYQRLISTVLSQAEKELYFNGIDSVSISKRLGHAKVSTTSDIYAHVIAEADRQNTDILESIYYKKPKKA